VSYEKSGIPVSAILSVGDLKRFAELEWDRETSKDVPPEENEREEQRSVAAAREPRHQGGRAKVIARTV
jgi:hypothetical protein